MGKTRTSWKPGQSGNPKGSPKKGESITELMSKYLNGYYGRTKIKRKDLFIRRVFNLAIHGDINCIRYIWTHLDGMPVQKQILSTDETEPFVIHIMGEKDGKDETDEGEEGPAGPADGIPDPEKDQ